METTGSILETIIERVRFLLEMPEADAKYLDNFLVNHAIMPAMVETWGRTALQSRVVPLVRYDVALAADQEYYPLPVAMQSLRRVTLWNADDGIVTDDSIPQNMMHPFGQNWKVEQNLFVVRPFPVSAQTVTLWYEPNGDVLPHYSGATNTGTLASGLQVLTLSSSPELGQIDRRENAYSGMMLRLLPTSGAIEERMILSHDVSAGTVTTIRPFTSDVSTGAYRYEIFPWWSSQPFIECIAARAAMKCGVGMKITGRHFQSIANEYRMSRKTLLDNLDQLQGRVPHHFITDTIDNPEFMARRVN